MVVMEKFDQGVPQSRYLQTTWNALDDEQRVNVSPYVIQQGSDAICGLLQRIIIILLAN